MRQQRHPELVALCHGPIVMTTRNATETDNAPTRDTKHPGHDRGPGYLSVASTVSEWPLL